MQFDVSLEQLRAAGEETRLRILYLLMQGDLSVTELTSCLGQLQPRVSRHLRILVDAGLVEPCQEGAWRFYRLAAAKAFWLPELLDRLEGEAVRAALEALARVREERAARAAAYFAQNASQWDAVRRLHIDERIIESAMLELAPDHAARFTDLGTGTGRMLVLFADRYAQGVGYDLSAEMLSVARVRLEEAGVRNASVRRRDIFAAAGDEPGADLVCLHHVLHFLDDPARAVEAAAGRLNPGGVLLIADFGAHRRKELMERYAHRKLGFASGELTGFAQGAGLSLREEVSLAPHSADGLTAKIWRLDKAPIRDTAPKEGSPLV